MSLTETFAALSEPNRQKILDLLKKGELSVNEIAKNLDITLATLSHHLDILKRADLISSRRKGQQIIYSLNFSILEEVAEKIAKFLAVKKYKNNN
ncbi:MAG: autorepressor SdpR family transcription factor [Patescibacteria group bacterium]